MQKGFLKGQRMLGDVEYAQLLWDNSADVTMLLIDFSKAYEYPHPCVLPTLRENAPPPPVPRGTVTK